MRGIKGILVTAVVTLGAFFAFGMVNGDASARDCSANSVIKCGTYSMSELRSKYNNDKTAGTKDIFSWFGISSQTVNNAEVRNGYVTKGGDVVVDGKVVADDAVTAGRQYMPSSNKTTHSGTTFYVRKPSASFQQNSLSAYVFFNKDGTFKAAVIKDCGNPVKADNKVKPDYKACDLTTGKIVTLDGSKPFNSDRYSKDLSDCEPIKVCDTTTGEIVTIEKPAFDSSKHSKDLADCEPIKVCDITTGKVVTIEKKQYDESKHTKDLSKCDSIEVCDLASADIVTIEKSEFDSSKHSKDLADCEPIKVCELETKQIITIEKNQFDSSKHSKNLEDCKEEPKNPGVEITKTVNGQEHAVVDVDGAFTYEVTVTNTGDVDLKDAVVTDNAPEGVTLTGADKGTVAEGGASWTHTIPTLAVGESISFTLNAVAPEYVEGVLENTVCVDTPTVPGEKDDCDDATVEVPAPGKVTVCELATGETITVTEEQAKDTSKYGPVDAEACNPTPEKPVETPTPEVPAELPQTGVAEVLSSVVGLGSLTAATYYFVTSRRS